MSPESSEGPGFLELAQQGLSSTLGGYDLLAPKFELTPYATPTEWIEEALQTVDSRYPRARTGKRGLDLACGTGRGSRALSVLCEEVLGVDFSPAMLEQARRLSQSYEGLSWSRQDLSTLELKAESYDYITTFGAWGHVLADFRRHLLQEILKGLRGDGVFVTLTADRADPWEKRYWQTLLFDSGVRVRNRLWPQEFHMYYRINSTEDLRRDFLRLGGPAFQVTLDRLSSLKTEPISLLVVRRRPTG